ncbi:hypothetical protein L208DRAFT_1251442 [Tricholoma matsutake]|nr:hypothetical protein L208DRAFT_1251442 [Tricholoma matsutake 945]
MHSNDPSTSGSDTDSLYSVSDFEVEYYTNWKQCYHELVHTIDSQLQLLDHWRLHSPECFRCKLCIEPQTFDSLLSLIKDHPIFHNNSNNDQLAIHIQLSVFLFCAGHYGNASSPKDTAQWAGISVGGVEKCTDHVIVALLSFHDEAIHFPDAVEKESLKSYVDEAVCPEWQGGFLLADGSKFPLYQRPGLHGNAWFDKDGAYSIDCQFITTPHNLMIADYSVGHTGSVHDSWAFRSTQIFKEHTCIFGTDEWMWADSAYPSETWSVSLFKKPANSELSPDQKTFNYYLSKVC